ncbi:MAG: hypothetical protein LV480_13325 [Methylacidiphilales bacterium]|nr:hypothetical protein [Candidatus Methylacidiphilales bacterium]
MKRLYRKASRLRSHTWRDIGGVGGLLLDAAFFIFLFVVSTAVMIVGVIAVLLAYLVHPVLALLSLRRGNQEIASEEMGIPLIPTPAATKAETPSVTS